MPLRLDIKRKLSNRSDRVKAVDFHPTEPWLVVALYSGNVHIWNHEKQNLVKTFEVTDLPVRAAKFIARKQWLITGADDMNLRVFNYNTHEKVTAFEGHSDYIRSIAVHAQLPLVLSASDDMTIKLWDWEKGWRCSMTFDGHSHYVMMVVFNPKDSNSFASASLDRTIKVWSLGSKDPNYTLEGHEKGVNCIDYYHGNDKPYLVSGGDDRYVKVWDYQNKSCVQTLESHTQNVTVVHFHPELPIIISGAEDGTVRLWHASTYRLENTLNYGMERIWCAAVMKGSNDVAFGYDEGTVVIKLGKEEPSMSMDNTGKLIYAKQNDIISANVSTATNVQDGERLALATKELGKCEVFPQSLAHSPNGRFVSVCGDGEYIIYTALAWRNKSFGQALECVWAADSNEYAIRDSSSRVRFFKAFKEKLVLTTSFSAEGIYGGTLLGVRSNTFICFYDWETSEVVRRIDVVVKNVFWSESDIVAIASEESLFLLKFKRAKFTAALESGIPISREGVEEAFEFIVEIPESVKTGIWVGDCFLFTNANSRLQYCVGEHISTLALFDSAVYILGYIVKEGRVYVADKDLKITSYALPLSLIEYQTAVLRGDLALADSVLHAIPQDLIGRVAKFLESQNMKEKALEVAIDTEHRFELAVALGKLEIAYAIAAESDSEEKWKAVGDCALQNWDFSLAQQCLERAKDYDSLLLIYQASGNAEGMKAVAAECQKAGKFNTAFLANMVCGNLDKCLEVLTLSERFPEAAFFAHTYLPSKTDVTVSQWKSALIEGGKEKLARRILTPADQATSFHDYAYGVFAENVSRQKLAKNGYPPAVEFQEYKDSLSWNIVEQIKRSFPNGPPKEQHPPAPATPKRSGPTTSAISSAHVSASPSATVKTAGVSLPSASPIPSPSGLMAGGSTATSSPSPQKRVDIVSPMKAAASLAHDPVLGGGQIRRSGDYVNLTAPRHDPEDTASHMSMEVNTTGTGSIRGDIDFDEMGSYSGDINSERSGVAPYGTASSVGQSGSVMIPDLEEEELQHHAHHHHHFSSSAAAAHEVSQAKGSHVDGDEEDEDEPFKDASDLTVDPVAATMNVMDDDELERLLNS